MWKPIYGNPTTKSTVVYLKASFLVFHFASTTAIYELVNKISNNWFLVKKDARAITKCSVKRTSTKIFKTHQSVQLICICSNKTEKREITQICVCAKFKMLLGQYGSVTGFMEQCEVMKSVHCQLIFTNEITLVVKQTQNKHCKSANTL